MGVGEPFTDVHQQAITIGFLHVLNQRNGTNVQ